MDPVHCAGFESELLQISPKLPEGLSFSNNILHGRPTKRFETQIFTISSPSKRSEDFYIRIGCRYL